MAQEMYFRFCEACNCYEYDCHGRSYRSECIKGEPDYKPAHRRHKERQEERLVELVRNETKHRERGMA